MTTVECFHWFNVHSVVGNNVVSVASQIHSALTLTVYGLLLKVWATFTEDTLNCCTSSVCHGMT